jgi:hypothetical protein
MHLPGKVDHDMMKASDQKQKESENTITFST